MNIRARLTLYFTLLIALWLVIRSLYTYISIYDFNEKEFYDRLNAKALTTASLLLKVEVLDSSLLKIIDRYQYDLLDNENISVYDSANTEIYTNNDSVNFVVSKALFDEIRKKKQIRYREGPYKIIAFYYADKSNEVVITAGAIDVGGEALLKRVRDILVLTLIGSVMVMCVIGWFFVGQALKPIAVIIQKVKSLSPVEHSERLPLINKKDEIAELVLTFNQLFDKLENAFRLQKNFVSNVSHELNNPLTKIKSQLEVSLMQNRDDESYRQTIQSTLEDVNELIVLIQDLMKLSRLTSGQSISLTPVRIDELLFDARDQVLAHFPDSKITVGFSNLPQNDERLIFNGNKQLMITALKNIIENGCKFSPDQSVSLHLAISKQAIVLSISDNGPGIPADELPNIFQLFYRSSSAESVKGYGIGLALAQKILQMHNIEVRAESAVGKGTTFVLTFSN